MKIIHVSDIHFGREDKTAVDAFNQHVKVNRPDLIIISGDLTQTGRRKEFFQAVSWVNTLPAPVAMVPGNHDTPALNLVARLLGPFRRYRMAFGSKSASGVYGEGQLALAHLNTAHGFQRRLDWSLGKVRGDELDAALSFFAKHNQAHWKIVACHHPLVDLRDTRVRGKTIGGQEALLAFADANVDLIVTGHTHVPAFQMFRHADRDIGLLSAGTLSERKREDAASFNQLELGSHNATIIQYAISSATVKETARHQLPHKSTPPAVATMAGGTG